MTVNAVSQMDEPLAKSATTKNWLAPAYIEQDRKKASHGVKPNWDAETPKAKETGK